MKKLLIALATLLGLATSAHAQGTLTIAANIQQNANGQPLAGALLYTYVINTVAVPQLTFQDVNLTIPNPWPLVADQNGRIPFFYLAAGGVHVRLTDAAGGVQFDVGNMLVIGGASGGGPGGGSQVDPSTIAQTGDIKFRFDNANLAGWIRLNGQTISSGTPGANNLYVYLWNNCPNSRCPVLPGGRGLSAQADFNANKTLQLIDMRDSILTGRDCMENTCLGGILLSDMTSGGTDTPDTPNAFGGVTRRTITSSVLPNAMTISVGGTINVSGNISVSGGSHGHTDSHSHGISYIAGFGPSGSNPGLTTSTTTPIGGTATNSASGFIGASGSLSMSGSNQTMSGTNQTMSGTLGGGGQQFPNLSPFKLGTWWIKL